jgi:hypothetical protein
MKSSELQNSRLILTLLAEADVLAMSVSRGFREVAHVESFV